MRKIMPIIGSFNAFYNQQREVHFWEQGLGFHSITHSPQATCVNGGPKTHKILHRRVVMRARSMDWRGRAIGWTRLTTPPTFLPERQSPPPSFFFCPYLALSSHVYLTFQRPKFLCYTSSCLLGRKYICPRYFFRSCKCCWDLWGIWGLGCRKM